MEKVKRELKDAVGVKQQSVTVLKLQREVEKASKDMERLELDLSATGNTKTVGEVEEALQELTMTMCVSVLFLVFVVCSVFTRSFP